MYEYMKRKFSLWSNSYDRKHNDFLELEGGLVELFKRSTASVGEGENVLGPDYKIM